MSKELRCGEIMNGCEYVVRGESEEEVLAKGAEHARTAHGVEELDAETVERVRAAIRDA
jgi:predicted small metal-binding protein